MNLKKTFNFYKIIVLFCMGVFTFVGCTRVEESKSEKASVSFVIPGLQTNSQELQLQKHKSWLENKISQALHYFGMATANTGPASLESFDCYLINVMGDGIGEYAQFINQTKDQKMCSYFSNYSSLISIKTGSSVSITIPTGKARKFQLLGLKSVGGCGINPLTSTALNNVAQFPAVYVLGETQVDIANDTNVTLNSEYNSASAHDARCSLGSSLESVDVAEPTLISTKVNAEMSASGVVLNWNAALDNKTFYENLKYKVMSAPNEVLLSTVAQAEAANQVMDWTENILTTTAHNLTPGTSYFFVVIVKDEAGNKMLYEPATISTPLSQFKMTTLNPTATSASIYWDLAEGALSYDVMYDSVSRQNSGTYAHIMTGVTSGVSVTGLTAGTTYYFRVRAHFGTGLQLSTNELTNSEFQTFNFSVPFNVGTESNYIFSDPQKIEFSNGKLRLVPYGQMDNNGGNNGFGAGTLKGTKWDATANVLRMDTQTNQSELNASWAPEWSHIVSYWKMNEELGTSSVSDSTSSANAAILHSGVTLGNNGKLNLAADFDGSNEALVTVENPQNLPSGDSQYTLSAWINPSYHTGTQGIIGYGDFGGYNRVNAFRLEGSPDNPMIVNYWWANDLTLNVPFPIENSWHYVVATWDGTVRSIYLDGVLLGSDRPTPPSVVVSNFAIGRTFPGNHEYFEGFIDEVVIWNKALTKDQINLIYERQSPAFAGEIKSRVVDSLSANQPWTQLLSLTTLPFYKELTGVIGSESSTDYSAISNNLVQDMLSYFSFNGNDSLIHQSDYTPEVGAAAKVWNANGYGLNFEKGYFNNALVFDGVDDAISLPQTTLSRSTSVAVSMWFKTRSNGGILIGYQNSELQQGLSNWVPILYIGVDGNLRGEFWNGGVNPMMSLTPVNDGNWHHVLLTASGNYQSLYLDGKVQGHLDGQIDHLEMYFNQIGAGHCSWPACNGGWQYFKGMIDEVGIWTKNLTPEEALQIYRRGANRLKFQVRTCSTLDCADKNQIAGQGWLGPDGSQLSYFSELYNTVSNILGESAASRNLFLPFANFSNLVVPNNRYFQYKTIFESDDLNDLCDYGSGPEICSPELKSVGIGPNRYDTGVQSVITKVSMGSSFKSLNPQGFIETISTNCSGVKYALSSDGTHFYSWNGTAWVISSEYATASVGSDLREHLDTFTAIAGSGILSVKTYLKSEGSTSCEVDELRFTGKKF